MSWFKRILPGVSTQEKKGVPEGVWTKCPSCLSILYQNDLERSLMVCPKCDHHLRIRGRKRLLSFLDADGIEEIGTSVVAEDRLKFRDSKRYKDRLSQAVKKTDETEALVVMRGCLHQMPVVACAFDFDFIGGSVGAAEGEAIIYGVQHAIDNKTPYIFFPCGGGQRMFESPIALANMTRTTLAINELKKNKLPYIVCFTDPTAGGITASFAMLGDIHFAETGCLIAFAGKRVIQATVKEELSPDFQTAEFVEKHGFVDKVVNRKNLKNEIGKLLEILLKKNSEVNSELSNETSTNIEQSTKAAS